MKESLGQCKLCRQLKNEMREPYSIGLLMLALGRFLQSTAGEFQKRPF